MKKAFLLTVILFCCFCAFSIGPVRQVEVHEFDSIPMLEKFYKEEEEVSSYWDDMEISLLTISQGNPLYSWFGHAGILVEDRSGYQILYDYGRFAFSADFYLNFIKGQLWYGCAGYWFEYELEECRESQRSIHKIVLDLTPQQKKAIAEFLEINSNEPYDRYLYHHYKDNCSTRLRDIINFATGGDFEKWAKAQSGYTFREQTSRILHRNIPVEWVLDLLQGPSIDEDATLWDEMFLPEILDKAVLEYGKIDLDHYYVEDFRETDKRPAASAEPQLYVTQSMITGAILALLALIFAWLWPKAYVVETSIVNAFLALVGTILFYMMFFSGHSFSWNNENILFINPLLFVPFIFGFKYRKHKKLLSIWYGSLTAIVTLIITVKMFNPILLNQANYPQLVAVLPYYMANFAICLKRSYEKRS